MTLRGQVRARRPARLICKLFNLPTITEVYRTFDNKLLTKTADLSQVLLGCHSPHG